MELFENLPNPDQNLLPIDGTVNYFGKVFDKDETDYLFINLLKNIEWKNDEAIIFGKKIITKRKVAWYGEEKFNYTYSKITKVALKFTPELSLIKNRVEAMTGQKFNSCLLNLYHDGSEGMAYHSDAEKDLKKNGVIASLSFGAERKFSFKHKESKERVDVFLENGSLLVMKDETQTHWLHRLPPTKKVLSERINLTFRQIDEKI
ncbi:alpha-ketoglutarate-dependent dioxygenase AlkB family protein [Frigoriflavimonas asaccharolytica]|uniref:Alkylated DNA repair dioxygenase AlkB n=1 Tax=Frigoriflavimonas asaccharolytica TaxID=2735899 RepID=A0A8J8G8R4_9FLAO|nr:alpha-ketoglutarate-dependent dioxygenase AlkB [Frigoriflavimonas asaccharolytica]NRS92022.1 alkylated DNA repair dioxygenase AlkB [Frigoriflavimonas asaccharolytica]